MASEIKPIKIWGVGGPNPPKVAMIVKELGIPHEIVPISFPDLKKPEYLAINPNGRMPAIQDPNSGLTLWESGAIIEYLVERYDKDHKLSFPAGTNEAYLAKQWLFFQASGQGPYYGQAAWFIKLHPEKLPSAIERYTKEIERITAVLEGHLAQEKEKSGAGSSGPWLVGGRISYADVAFLSWQVIIQSVVKEGFDQSKFPLVDEWVKKMQKREVIEEVMDAAMQGRK
ncbi:glutathione S-transferas-like protein [Massariosphaeria phaeospora]|uniref:Glutathione S-transferas-like protein n=1 Tax=Massariosphaeria phaeospora TaxID=100035 RepID=A0A7C8MRC9_9PLEO|nr:glutathione S-transferas-like protein [Massariosphaeria phaeospora]